MNARERPRCVYCGRTVKRGHTACGFHNDLPALDYGELGALTVRRRPTPQVTEPAQPVSSPHRRSQGRQRGL